MSLFSKTPNMSLIEPGVGLQLSPTWADEVNRNFSTIDGHDHSNGYGVQIKPPGIDINTDLAFNGNNATFLRTTRFTPFNIVTATVTRTGSDVTELGVDVSGDLYYINSLGNPVRITNGNDIVGSLGTIAGLVSPASATYVAGTGTFVWQSNSGVAASMDAGEYILRYSGGYPSPSGNFVALQAPASLSSGYAITFPLTTPVSTTSFMNINTSGGLGYWTVDNSTLAISGSNVIVNTGGITATQVATNTTFNGDGGFTGSISAGGSITSGSFIALPIAHGIRFGVSGTYPELQAVGNTSPNGLSIKSDSGAGSELAIVVSGNNGSSAGRPQQILRGTFSIHFTSGNLDAISMLETDGFVSATITGPGTATLTFSNAMAGGDPTTMVQGDPNIVGISTASTSTTNITLTAFNGGSTSTNTIYVTVMGLRAA